MKYDWKALSPTRPLGPAETATGSLYVPRLGEGAKEIDALLNAGLEQPIGIFGPAGAGKSTELAALAELRQTCWVGPLIRLDKVLPYSDATSTDDVLTAIAHDTIRIAGESLGLKLPGTLGSVLDPPVEWRGLKGFDFLLAAVREIRSASRQRSVGLLVDGLEKASGGLARRTLANLERLRGEAQVVVVIPMDLATGPAASALHEYHAISIGPVVVTPNLDPSADEGTRFLFEVVARRLGVASRDVGRDGDTTAIAIRRAILLSGGLVRTCLQLVQKAALYAVMRGKSAPDVEDVDRAGREQQAFLLRLLKDGDIAALRAVHGTTGIELEMERRVRFLANGLVLEYRTARGTVARVCPLLESRETTLREGLLDA